MSEQYDKFQQVRLLPDNVKALNQARQRERFKPSLAEFVNQIIREWAAQGKQSKPKP